MFGRINVMNSFGDRPLIIWTYVRDGPFLCMYTMSDLGGRVGYEEMAVQISGGKINTYTQKHVFQLNIFQVYMFFFSVSFVFKGGWVGHRKSEHCSDFKNTYTKMDDP